MTSISTMTVFYRLNVRGQKKTSIGYSPVRGEIYGARDAQGCSYSETGKTESSTVVRTGGTPNAREA